MGFLRFSRVVASLIHTVWLIQRYRPTKPKTKKWSVLTNWIPCLVPTKFKMIVTVLDKKIQQCISSLKNLPVATKMVQMLNPYLMCLNERKLYSRMRVLRIRPMVSDGHDSDSLDIGYLEFESFFQFHLLNVWSWIMKSCYAIWRENVEGKIRRKWILYIFAEGSFFSRKSNVR